MFYLKSPIRVLFVCHGNICRSPMAEFVFRHLVAESGVVGIEVDSAALHTDEIGNDIHPGTRRVLQRYGIPFAPRSAWLLDRRHAQEYDLIIGMDSANLRDLRRLLPSTEQHRVHLLLEWTSRADEEIADPWYTGNFEETYRDIRQGCQGLLKAIRAGKHDTSGGL